MTKIKLCGLTRLEDIDAANEISAEFIGFVFAEKSRRFITPEKANALRPHLGSKTKAVGVFANVPPEYPARIANAGIIDMIQLHSNEDGEYIKRLRTLCDKPVIKAFRVTGGDDIKAAAESDADYVLLDSGAGTGTVFDWELAAGLKREYFLAGGLTPANAARAVELLHPYAADVSSGIETDFVKDKAKMAAFAAAVRKEG